MCCYAICFSSDNNLSGRIGSLPAAVWNVDVSGNDLTGPLPALATLMYLEQFVANANNFEGGIPGEQGTQVAAVSIADLLVDWVAAGVCSMTGTSPRRQLCQL